MHDVIGSHARARSGRAGEGCYLAWFDGTRRHWGCTGCGTLEIHRWGRLKTLGQSSFADRAPTSQRAIRLPIETPGAPRCLRAQNVLDSSAPRRSKSWRSAAERVRVLFGSAWEGGGAPASGPGSSRCASCSPARRCRAQSLARRACGLSQAGGCGRLSASPGDRAVSKWIAAVRCEGRINRAP